MSVEPSTMLRAVAAPDGVVDVRPRVPDGIYRLSYLHHETRMMFGRAPKLGLHFTVCDPFQHVGVRLIRWYNVLGLIGKVGRQGRFKASAGGDLVIEYCTLFGAPGRFDRISLERFEEGPVIGEVRTVKENAAQAELPLPLRYSVIAKLVKRA